MDFFLIFFIITIASARSEDALKCFVLSKIQNTKVCKMETMIGEKECAKYDSKYNVRKASYNRCASSKHNNDDVVTCFCRGVNCPLTEDNIKSQFDAFFVFYREGNEDAIHPREACLHSAFLPEQTKSTTGSSEGAPTTLAIGQEGTPALTTTVATTTTTPGTTPAVGTTSPPITTSSPENTVITTTVTTKPEHPTNSPVNPNNISVDSGVNGFGKTVNNSPDVCLASNDKTFLYVALAVLSTLLAVTWIINLYSCIKNRKKVEPKQAEVLPTKVSRSAAPEVALPVLVNEEKVKSNPPPPPTVAPPTLGRVDIQNLDAGFGNETTDESSTISTTTTTTNQG